MSPTTTVTDPPGRGGQPIEHRRAGVDAGHGEPGAGEWDGQPAGADAQFEHRPAGPARPAIAGDRGVDVGDRGVPVVVHVGERLAVGVGAVALHRPQAMARHGRPIRPR